MTIIKEKAMDLISRMPEDKLYYIVQLLESVEGLSEQKMIVGEKTLEKMALEDLKRLRKVNPVEIDYKAELASAWEEKYAVSISADYIVTRNTKDFSSSRIPAALPDEFLEKV